MDDADLTLAGADLEDAVGKAFATLGATVRRGPPGEHDLELSFERPCSRPLGGGRRAILFSDVEFVVEVKSRERHGARLEDLRQLDDWVGRAMDERSGRSRREREADVISAGRRVREELLAMAYDPDRRQDALAAAAVGCPAVDDVALEDERDAIATMTKRPKGLLVVNHVWRKPVGERGAPFTDELCARAGVHEFALLSWPTLRLICQTLELAHDDAINLFCALYEAHGEVTVPLRYDWRERCGDFQQVLFGKWCGYYEPLRAPPFFRCSGSFR